MLTDRWPAASPVAVELQAGDQPMVIETHNATIHTRLGTDENVAATLTGPPRPIMGLLLGLLELADDEASGVTYHGDPAIVDRIAADTTRPAASAATAPPPRTPAGGSRRWSQTRSLRGWRAARRPQA
jgi:hypothetical protein